METLPSLEVPIDRKPPEVETMEGRMQTATSGTEDQQEHSARSKKDAHKHHQEHPIHYCAT